ncbi:DUF3558 domain-containing protein [Streptomyces sp. ACA25]|uniref:DUF3558 domain-containing protein n=1 Tax=Streptomyces sp. ACA25 TaxID=3022596 RepID=UPI0023076D00|nr:DUF3558 domain-containing protein [Streptomyces sp. ACA25]MDB1087895.1 DUF3558 domain-containing protein [Streptomyces sp. ACA25]
MDRTATRFALRTLSWAVVPVLLVAGCSSDSGGGTPEGDSVAVTDPTPEPVRFSALPEPCSTVGADTIGDVVPEAEDEDGEALDSTDLERAGTCLWSGLDGYDFRSLTVAMRRFDSDLSIGSGDERAAEYLRQTAEEVTGDGESQDVEEAGLEGLGDEATTISYLVVKENSESESRDYRQQRVVIRVDNVVVTVDHTGTGFEDGEAPDAESVRENAEQVAREVVTALVDFAGTTENDDADDENGGDDVDEEDAEDGKEEDSED